MKEYRNDNRFYTPKRRKKTKHHTFLYCCLALFVLAVGLVVNQFPFTVFDAGIDTHEQSSIDESAWYLILVNKWNYMPDNYEVELTELANGQSVDKRIYPALQEMLDSATNNGIGLIVVSGYRTMEKQQSLMDEKIAEYIAQGYSTEEAIKKAEAWVAIPGTSEHQLGIAVDINSAWLTGPPGIARDIHSGDNDVYEWLDKNAYKFGFIRRYPPDKTEITGVIDEPWHYRYVGIEAATEIYNQGICLEEYLNRIN